MIGLELLLYSTKNSTVIRISVIFLISEKLSNNKVYPIINYFIQNSVRVPQLREHISVHKFKSFRFPIVVIRTLQKTYNKIDWRHTFNTEFKSVK